jgi:hypothetical protein
MSQNDEAARAAAARFEERWQRALAQPEVTVVDAKKIELDTSPGAILAGLREMADLSSAKGELGAKALDSIRSCSDELERAFSAVAPDRLQDLLGALKARLRGPAPK